MAQLIILTFIELFVFVFNLLLIIRVIMSLVVSQVNPVYSGLVGITEPLLLPVRKVLPMTPGIDFTPMVVIFLLEGLQYLAGKLLGS